MSEHGTIHWSELLTSDVKAAKDFFTKVVGWRIDEMPMPNGAYNVCMVGDRPVAGIMSAKMAQGEVPPTGWYTYIAVDDVDAACKTCTSAGGKVRQQPFDVPNVGRIAMVVDPSGGVVGIMTPARQG